MSTATLSGQVIVCVLDDRSYLKPFARGHRQRRRADPQPAIALQLGDSATIRRDRSRVNSFASDLLRDANHWRDFRYSWPAAAASARGTSFVTRTSYALRAYKELGC